MLSYIPNEHDLRLKEVFDQGKNSVGFDSVPSDPELRGIIALHEHTLKEVLIYVQKGLEKEDSGVSPKKAEALYMKGQGY
jgi:hypothetical protein